MAKSIRIDDDVLDYIAEHGKFGETHSDVLRRLIPNFPVPNGKATQGKSKLAPIFGHSVVSVIRWMGGEGWSEEAVRKVLAALDIEAKDNTIKTQLYHGKKGTLEQAKLTVKQATELNSLREK
jgi:hypothetical protein